MADDRDADYTAYVDARWAVLVRAGVLLGCSRPEAEDLAQTALLRCYQSWSKVQRAQSRDAYVYRVLVNCLTKSRRRRWSGELPSEQPPEPGMAYDDPVGDQVSSRAAVRAGLAQLPEAQRVAVVLRYFADLSERQVAEITAVPAGTVKSRLSRGLAELTRLLDDSAERSPRGDLTAGTNHEGEGSR